MGTPMDVAITDASATATIPSPTLPAADNSISCARPVLPAPPACVILCSVREVPLAAAAPARPAVCEAETNDLAACLARAPARKSPMDIVLSLPVLPRHHGLGQ